MTKLRKIGFLTLTAAACINLAGCALFYEDDDGPTPEQLKAIEKQYRSREKKRAQALSAGPIVIDQQNTLVMNAMIGQVNGNAIYADEVFSPIHDQLSALGKRLSREEFLTEIRGIPPQKPGIIQQNITSIVQNALIYGDAERNLTNNERYVVKMYTQKNREFLVRMHGQGSYALADKTLKEDRGIGIEEVLENERRRFIIQRYVDSKITPLVNVSRGDIERYYRDHPEIFNPKTVRDTRLIGVTTAQAASQVQSLLSKGTSFADIAKSDLNERLRISGGLFQNQVGDAPFTKSLDLLNQKLVELVEGEYTTEPIKIGKVHWFLSIEKLQKHKALSLRDAQIPIDKELRDQQFKKHVQQYNENLFIEGSYDNLEDMTNTLIQIAMNRYAQPE
ncbi:hypothetical protein JD969_06625 [Planctomycetota bacterium]|nr:hypothetical protein JD969_06625 [Planctomycetota bacterium]